MLKALTGSLTILQETSPEPVVTLKNVFKLPSKLPGIRLPRSRNSRRMARSAPIDRPSRRCSRDGWARDRHGHRHRGSSAEDDAADACRRLGIGQSAQLSYLWEYALTSGWFELIDSADRRYTWAEIGQTAWRWTDGDDRGALHVWAAVFAAVAATALDVMADADPDAARRLNFQGQGVALAVMLFMSRRNGMTTRDVEDLVREARSARNPTCPAQARLGCLGAPAWPPSAATCSASSPALHAVIAAARRQAGASS